MTLEKDYTVDEVAEALGMSERWVRRKCKEGAVHNRYGHKIRFTTEQVELLRADHTTGAVVPQAVTTGPKRRRSA